MAFKFSSLLGKSSDYAAEYKRFHKSMERNPGDHGLKTQFIKFCLLNRFTKQDIVKEHITEALRLFDSLPTEDSFDLQCHYLVGKYYQEDKDARRAYKVYLNAVKRFNDYVEEHPGQKSDNADLAYSVALNLMNLQSNPIDPEIEKCFKLIRKSFPLHLARIKLENEMAKPAPDQARIKQLGGEIKKLRAEEEKEITAAAEKARETPEKPEEMDVKTSGSNGKESKGIFSKLFEELSPEAVGLSVLAEKDIKTPPLTPEKTEKMDYLKFTPPEQGTAFMAYHGAQWKGPYTISQLKSLGFLEPATWVCRAGSQQVLQAYEVPDLQALLQK